MSSDELLETRAVYTNAIVALKTVLLEKRQRYFNKTTFAHLHESIEILENLKKVVNTEIGETINDKKYAITNPDFGN